MARPSSAEATDRQPPRGRPQVVDAIIEACETLCERSTPSAFTIIDLAAEAGITTSLLYHYFGSKDEIIAETLRRFATEADRVAAEQPHPTAMVAAVRRLVWERPAFARIVTSLTLEGTDVTELMGEHPFLQRLMRAAAAPHPEDPETYAGKAVIDILAMAVLGPTVNHALGRDRRDPRILGIEEL